MLEERKYTIAEMAQITGTQNRQGIRRKLENYDIAFEESGRGNTVVFDVKNIPDKFKVFCIIDLGFSSQTDFKKLMYLFNNIFFFKII